MVRYPILEDMIWLYSIGRGKIHSYEIFKDFKDFGVKNNENQYFTLSAITVAIKRLEKQGWFKKISKGKGHNEFIASMRPILMKQKKRLEESNDTEIKERIKNFKIWVVKHHRYFNMLPIFNNLNKEENKLKYGRNLLELYDWFHHFKIMDEMIKSGINPFDRSFIGKAYKMSYSDQKNFIRDIEKTFVFTTIHEKFYNSKEEVIKDYLEMVNLDE
jgi:hypothetical protein